VAWEGIDGALGQQARPDWAQQPTTTAPEPAGLVLLGSGGLALLAVRRRVRTA